MPAICDAPNDPSAMLAAFWGYATVNVNIRGTGPAVPRPDVPVAAPRPTSQAMPIPEVE